MSDATAFLQLKATSFGDKAVHFIAVLKPQVESVIRDALQHMPHFFFPGHLTVNFGAKSQHVLNVSNIGLSGALHARGEVIFYWQLPTRGPPAQGFELFYTNVSTGEAGLICLQLILGRAFKVEVLVGEIECGSPAVFPTVALVHEDPVPYVDVIRAAECAGFARVEQDDCRACPGLAGCCRGEGSLRVLAAK